MASNLKCSICGKPATVHFTQIVNNQVHKVDLCEACAQAKGITDPTGFSLADLLVKAALNTPETASPSGLRCKRCGFTQADFKKYGRFGCPDCYETFRSLLEPMLEGMHKGVHHTGKVPHQALGRINYQEQLSRLESDLHEAVRAERYEDAARFRDQITQVKQSMLEHQQHT